MWITPRPLARHWDLLPRETGLPDGPTTLPPNFPPDPLTAIVSGRAGSWHLGHALYCLWTWAQQRWPHSRQWSAAWRLHLDGWRQAEVTSPHEQENPPTTANLFLVFVIYQIQALAAGQVLPTCTEAEAPAAHAALVSELIDHLHSALVRHLGNPMIP